MSKSTRIGGSKTCALAVYTRDHAVIRAVAATLGILPADVVKVAIERWVEKQEPGLQHVVGAVEQRLAKES